MMTMGRMNDCAILVIVIGLMAFVVGYLLGGMI
jgi:hypothetical protein